jgi:S1-C subfamily serine protease
MCRTRLVPQVCLTFSSAFVCWLVLASNAWSGPISYEQQGPRMAAARINHWFNGYKQVPFCKGTGTFIARQDERGLVLTAAHLFEDGSGPITVEFSDGQVSGATLLAKDDELDVAALWIYAPRDIPPLPLGESDPKVGEQLEIWGYGPDRFRSFMATVASPRLKAGEAPDSLIGAQGIQNRMVTIPGDSGGPLVLDDQLVGVHWGYRGFDGDPERAVQAVPSRRLRSWLQARLDGSVRQRMLGF